MELTNPTNQPRLPHQVIADSAHNLARRTESMDRASAQVSVEAYNLEVVEAGLMNETITVQGDYVLRSKHVLNHKTGNIEISYITDDSLDPVVEGVFHGFRVIEHPRGNTLFYQLQTEYDPDSMTFFMAEIPAEDAEILDVEKNMQQRLDELVANLNESITLLSTIEDNAFRKKLKEFLNTAEKTDDVDAAFFNKLGVLAAEMLTHEVVKKDTRYHRAVVVLLTSLVSPTTMYRMRGHSFLSKAMSGKDDFTVSVVEVDENITAIQLVSAYSVNHKEKSIKLHEDELQPAFVTVNDNGDIHLMPLVHLSEMEIIGYDTDASCETAMGEFREFTRRVA